MRTGGRLWRTLSICREVYAAGRLDLDSEGLLLLTSDGRLAHYITDPQHKLPKVYLSQIERIPNEEASWNSCEKE